MRQLLIQVILYNFQLIEQTPVADRSNISDVLESFLNFNALIAKKVPSAFDDPEIDCDKLISYGKISEIQHSKYVSSQKMSIIEQQPKYWFYLKSVYQSTLWCSYNIS